MSEGGLGESDGSDGSVIYLAYIHIMNQPSPTPIRVLISNRFITHTHDISAVDL